MGQKVKITLNKTLKRRTIKERRWHVLLISFLVLTLLVLGIVFFILNGPWAYRLSGTRNSRIVSNIDQARTVMTYIHYQEGNYDSFNCEHEVMVTLCHEIDRNYGKEDGEEPLIAHDAPNNSQAACIYSPLDKKNNHYWYCADSTMRADYVGINPGSDGYCVEGESAVCPPLLEEIP